MTGKNDGILILLDKKATLAQSFLTIDRVLLETIQSLTGLISAPHVTKLNLDDICAALPHRARDIAVVTVGRVTGCVTTTSHAGWTYNEKNQQNIISIDA
jgi:cell division GTPase FtsZ